MFRVAFSPVYRLPLPETHRFPMLKYELLPEQLLYEGTLAPEQFFDPEPLPESEVLFMHDSEYWRKLKTLALSRKEERRMGFPQSEALIFRELKITQGTIDCALHAMRDGVALNVSGGTHHAFSDRGEGFCLLNDIAVASHFLLRNGFAKKILVIDLDVHQGNGTAQLFQDNDAVFTLSFHGADNYPLEKEVSDLDVPLKTGTRDADYLDALGNILPETLKEFQPDFAFFQAGVDVLGADRLGRLELSHEGCKKRDEFVFETLRAEDVPVAVVMGGGYARDIRDILRAHCNTYRAAANIYG